MAKHLLLSTTLALMALAPAAGNAQQQSSLAEPLWGMMTLNEDELTYPRGMYKINTDLTREHLWTDNPTYVGFSMLSGWNTDGTLSGVAISTPRLSAITCTSTG